MSVNAFTSTSSDRLEKLLSQDSSYFEEVLNEPIVFKALKNNSKEARHYFSHHLPRLLRIAFREDTHPTTITAFKLLKLGNIPNLVKSSFFSGFAVKILSKDEIKPMIIGRLSDISLSILQSGNSDILRYCGFILLILKYADNANVYNLFSSILANDEKLKSVQDWLFDIGFFTDVSEMLKEALLQNYSENYSNDHEKLINLLRIASDSLSNSRIRDRVLSGPIPLAFQNYRSFPTFISNFYWETLNQLFDKKAPKTLEAFAKAAQDLLVTPTHQIHIYHANSVKFLTNFIKVRPDLINDELIKSVLGLMIQFETSSCFLNAAGNFFVELYRSSSLSSHIKEFLALVFLNEANQKKKTTFQMLALKIVEELAYNDLTRKSFRQISGASEFIKQKLEIYRYKKEHPYGYPKEEVQDLYTRF
ncbi:hypothetical protein TRFO_02307 [Tritrichomonas foetus]|uniref:Uncharacterized protein n=1 Tax=Tritrichomonas foetus TaxID=1144522 RepID=A0A1J4J8R8_9EUKA|nr:hypothetical protein TRFO_02307 [Tritrichomonas foetus]|eukprot:OHS93797.1 hypothetical protein TRFO_02307 [Tritrichomonas foetus]